MIERDELYDYPSLQPRKSSQAIYHTEGKLRKSLVVSLRRQSPGRPRCLEFAGQSMAETYTKRLLEGSAETPS